MKKDTKKRNNRRRKLPNSFGSITELKGKRKKKSWARVTVGIDKNGNPVRKSIGTYLTYNDAYEAILNYHKKHYNIDFNNIIVEDLFNLTLESIKEKYNKPRAKTDGKKTISRYDSTFKNYYKPVKRKIFKNLTKDNIQFLIDNCEYGYDVKCNIKSVYNAMYNKAKEKGADLLDNFSEFLDLGEQVKSKMHIDYSKEEIKLLWDNIDIVPNVDLVLITIYTGLRPSELCELEKEKMYLNKKYAIGGNKTEAGIDREIVFCNKIFPLIKKIYNSNNSKYFLPSVNNPNKPMAYNTLSKRFKNVFKILKIDHKPHDGRHTLETQLCSLGVADYMRNSILGHEQEGVGNKTYNHIPLEDKLKAINKINKIC